LPPIELCPGSEPAQTPDSVETTVFDDEVERCLAKSAENLMSVQSDPAYTFKKVALETLCPPRRRTGTEAAALEHNLQASVVAIAWELLDNTAARATLRINSIENLVDVIQAAASYQIEYADVSYEAR
jgi:hypothetical protein